MAGAGLGFKKHLWSRCTGPNASNNKSISRSVWFVLKDLCLILFLLQSVERKPNEQRKESWVVLNDLVWRNNVDLCRIQDGIFTLEMGFTDVLSLPCSDLCLVST